MYDQNYNQSEYIQTNYDYHKYSLQPDQSLFLDGGRLKDSVVYLVDDDYDDRIYAYSMLQQSDRVVDVKPVKCAESLFRCLDNLGMYDSAMLVHHPALILLDMHMPGMNGMEALAEIRTHPITSDIPVVLLTSDISEHKVERASALHVNGYLEKPFDLKQFHEVMNSGCGGPSSAHGPAVF